MFPSSARWTAALTVLATVVLLSFHGVSHVAADEGEQSIDRPAATQAVEPSTGNRLPSRRQLLGHDGVPCQQTDSCKFLSDVLVICHLNPQRPEWVDAILDLALLFVPNLVFFSVIPTRLVQNLTEDQQHSTVQLFWAGRRRTKVHLVDSHLQIFGDHHDLATAMRLWPGFTGYLAWEHEDSLIAWWNLAAPGRFDKQAPWHQPVCRGGDRRAHRRPSGRW
eukprot:TRINITY_DN14818_c0_g1_i3.p1 TRINITY_DN14818_c0_g1~~TRINITY_DN14818_c0_g1_i3.p1  ORF type:complete len:221 (+),score=56.90 TRINITY_DN14818_c0_g1_i3:50-712(+)